jgi:hypothetical protein
MPMERRVRRRLPVRRGWLYPLFRGSGKWLIRSVDVRGQVDRDGFLRRPAVPSQARANVTSTAPPVAARPPCRAFLPLWHDR